MTDFYIEGILVTQDDIGRKVVIGDGSTNRYLPTGFVAEIIHVNARVRILDTDNDEDDLTSLDQEYIDKYEITWAISDTPRLDQKANVPKGIGVAFSTEAEFDFLVEIFHKLGIRIYNTEYESGFRGFSKASSDDADVSRYTTGCYEIRTMALRDFLRATFPALPTEDELETIAKDGRNHDRTMRLNEISGEMDKAREAQAYLETERREILQAIET